MPSLNLQSANACYLLPLPSQLLGASGHLQRRRLYSVHLHLHLHKQTDSGPYAVRHTKHPGTATTTSRRVSSRQQPRQPLPFSSVQYQYPLPTIILRAAFKSSRCYILNPLSKHSSATSLGLFQHRCYFWLPCTSCPQSTSVSLTESRSFIGFIAFAPSACTLGLAGVFSARLVPDSEIVLSRRENKGPTSHRSPLGQ